MKAAEKMALSGMQSIIDEDFNFLRISTPAPRSWIAIIFLCIWLAGWAFGEILAFTIIVSILSDMSLTKETLIDSGGYIAIGCIGTFLLVWIVLWTYGGIQAIRNILWQLAGWEIINFAVDFITIRRPIFGIGKSEEFILSHIEKLRIESDPSKRLASLGRSKRFSRGTIAFEYGGSPIRIGVGLPESDAAHLLDRIVRRFPNYQTHLDE